MLVAVYPILAEALAHLSYQQLDQSQAPAISVRPITRLGGTIKNNSNGRAFNMTNYVDH
jgi:hypothetical protein